jgi:hypothetical protein
MLVAPDAALLITLSRLALAASTGDICAAIGAVALATVTLAANQNLRLASCAKEKPAGLIVQDTSGSTPAMAGL